MSRKAELIIGTTMVFVGFMWAGYMIGGFTGLKAALCGLMILTGYGIAKDED